METTPRLRLPIAALIGVLAVASALAAGHLVAGFVGTSASPFLAVGNAAIDLTPEWLKEFAVRNFGTHDKLVLLIGMAVTLFLIAVVAGLLSRRTPVPGMVIAGVFGVVGIVAVLNRPDTAQLSVLAPIASLLAGVGVFKWLHGIAAKRAAGEAGEGMSRRKFLYSSAGVAVGAGLFGGAGQLLSGSKDIEASRAAIGQLRPKVPAPPIPAGADFHAIGAPTFLTPNKDFYRIDTAFTLPRVLAEEWQLRIHGKVDREQIIRFDDIRRRDLIEKTITMTCVSNEVGGPYVSTANFIGVPLRDLLMQAGIQDQADQVFSTSADGWTTATPVADLLDEERGAMLAIGMNGEALPLEHGFPARVVVPGLYGYASAIKWVTDMELIAKGSRTFYWQDRGWAEEAPIKLQSRIDAPGPFASFPPGKVQVAGIAWAQTTGISKVEVRVDGGPWQEAELATEVNINTWRQWRSEFDLTSGNHRVEVRATDKAGNTQTQDRVPPIPDGATGWHSIAFSVS
ncbi:molybdopterin-dependent oxidoreductase [Actinokineospora bangkokensis]|uniref:Molybdopterin-binding protein n=1 Tax=Actinokineospora bangkokensis TaxID=1193682 RepID=A0A1Q9LFF1_9PSEU|nr:molybdopterin-dependent oxidoreductase [Actinokineospora bangkokensis]OLR90744.1 molybdopterin-binding protein [Actinokineospora bangkokensis]